MTKTLEEFIKNYIDIDHVKPEDTAYAVASIVAMQATAAEILRVAHDCSFDAYTNEGQKIRVVMLEDLESYIQPAKKESERL